MIKKDVIRQIIDTARIDEVISEFVTLKKRGSNLLGLCPFHNEKTPSFTVSPAKGIYKCFGCGKAGDVIRFMMDHDQLSYPEALRFLAARYQIDIGEEFESEDYKEAENLKEGLYLVNQFALDFFSHSLWETEKGNAIALSYFRERGLNDKTMRLFHLGYNADERSEFSEAAIKKGYNKEFLVKTGLSIEKEAHYYDRFRGRVIFPIHNLSGRVIGFGGRTLRSDKTVAKYVNSPESEVYNKSRELYGLYFAKKDIVKEDFCYLVEGYTDVISMFQSGVTNVVAPLGTSLTEDQIKLIKRYTSNIVLLFDGDAAGLKATTRAIDMILASGLNVHVITFPEGQDPDSYSKSHSDTELREFLEKQKKDFISFLLQSLNDAGSDDPVIKAELMKSVIESISKIPDHLTRSLFLKHFSQKTGIDEKSAIFELNRRRRDFLKHEYQGEDVIQPPSVPLIQHNEEGKKLVESGSLKKEEKIVSYLLRYGVDHIEVKVNHEKTAMEKMTMLVSEYIVTEIERDEVVFRDETYGGIYQYFMKKIERDEFPDNRELMESENEEIKNVCISLMTSRHELSENWYKKFHIFTPGEKENLLKFIDRDLNSLKLVEVSHRLSESEEKMKNAGDEEQMVLMEQQNLLRQAKKAIVHLLGRQ